MGFYRCARKSDYARRAAFGGVANGVNVNLLVFYGACVAHVGYFLHQAVDADGRCWHGDRISLACILPGMLLVVGGVDARFYIGIAVGALSALLAAAFGLMNKELVAKVDALTLSFIEISIGGALMWLLLFCSSGSFDIPMPTAADWPNLLIFALFCTALPFAMSNVALKQISAFSAQFAVNLEPIYGIVFAAWLLHETKQLTPQFYIGASVILLAVFAQVLISVKARRT